MKTGKSFIKRNIEWLILAIVMLCMHVLYLFLIGHPEGDLIYAGILDLCIIAFALCIAYIRYDRKVRYLKDMLQQPFSGEMKLPETEDVTEELLGQLVENANIERQLTLNTAARQQSEMKDYYAKWVHQIKTPIAGLQLLLQMERSELEEAESKDEITEELYVKQLQNLTDVEEEPQHIWLEIRDTGIGIRSEDIPRVFEKGYTGFNGHEDKRSTGIGLYLCREVLQKLGHTIQVQSEVGEGTTVRAGFSKDAIDFRD